MCRRSFRISASTAITLLLAISFSRLGDGVQLGMERTAEEGEVINRRRLGGPGSAPPSCRSKCGKCEPCEAVHVPIHPGASVPLEYYPEAWRCKCRNKLYSP